MMLLLFTRSFAKHFAEQAILLLITSVWQDRLVVTWYQYELHNYSWIWQAIFHFILIGGVFLVEHIINLTSKKQSSPQK